MYINNEISKVYLKSTIYWYICRIWVYMLLTQYVINIRCCQNRQSVLFQIVGEARYISGFKFRDFNVDRRLTGCQWLFSTCKHMVDIAAHRISTCETNRETGSYISIYRRGGKEIKLLNSLEKFGNSSSQYYTLIWHY